MDSWYIFFFNHENLVVGLIILCGIVISFIFLFVLHTSATLPIEIQSASQWKISLKRIWLAYKLSSIEVVGLALEITRIFFVSEIYFEAKQAFIAAKYGYFFMQEVSYFGFLRKFSMNWFEWDFQ